MIGIVDYGMGNLRSVQKALEHVGAQAHVVTDVDELHSADKLVLPGVGAFGDAMTNLEQRGLIEPLLDFMDAGRPFLGICLGMQLLFEISDEGGEHQGLGVLGGRVTRFPDAEGLKVPHMGWNTLDWEPGSGDSSLLLGVDPGSSVYFVHAYYCVPTDAAVVATETIHGERFCSAIRHNNIMATQFHPEKSQQVGLTMLRNFAKM